MLGNQNPKSLKLHFIKILDDDAFLILLLVLLDELRRSLASVCNDSKCDDKSNNCSHSFEFFNFLFKTMWYCGRNQQHFAPNKTWQIYEVLPFFAK